MKRLFYVSNICLWFHQSISLGEMQTTYISTRVTSLRVIACVVFALVMGVLTSCPLKASLKGWAKADIEESKTNDKAGSTSLTVINGPSCSLCSAFRVDSSRPHSLQVTWPLLGTYEASRASSLPRAPITPVTLAPPPPPTPIYLLYRTLLI